jgi:thiamine biosynthesis lipoprotein
MIQSVPLMGTIVTIHVVDRADRVYERGEPAASIERALEWFREIETRCSRFDPASELMRVSAAPGVPVPVSPLVYEAVQFALAVADETSGAFDPTIGRDMMRRGFNIEDRSGRRVQAIAGGDDNGAASYRDVSLDAARRAITIGRPLVLDLGSIAKGLAIDMAARELARFDDFVIDAGGDLYLAGRNPERLPWTVGIRHPRRDGELIDAIQVSDHAVCTSGDYERRAADGHHLIDPRTRESASAAASVTVVASTAMVADALATAAFVLGPADGLGLLERQGVDGLILTPALERFATDGMASMFAHSGTTSA